MTSKSTCMTNTGERRRSSRRVLPMRSSRRFIRFLDGNRAIGRLLINLLFVADGVLSRPFFYLSLYLKENRADYYAALQRVRTHGDWEGWLRFYLIGVEAVARQATQTTQALSTLFQEDEARVRLVGRSAGTALRGVRRTPPPSYCLDDSPYTGSRPDVARHPARDGETGNEVVSRGKSRVERGDECMRTIASSSC